MVPLEEEAAGSAGGSAAFVERLSEGATGAAAPFSILSKFAFKDALLELEATVRKTRDVSSAAVLQLWQVAEKGLGVEVDIEDPALRGLFGLHVVAVEELCSRVRAQAEVSFAAAEMWAQPQLGLTAPVMKLLGDCEKGDGSQLGLAISEDLAEAEAAAAKLRQRFSARIQAEVLDDMAVRLQEHADIREVVRERQRWSGFAVAARRDVARFRKEPQAASSGLLGLGGRSSSPLEEAELRLREASERVAQLDTRLLEGLRDLSDRSVSAVRRPWAALVQIQAEFFMAQQAMWVPLVDAFRDFGAES